VKHAPLVIVGRSVQYGVALLTILLLCSCGSDQNPTTEAVIAAATQDLITGKEWTRSQYQPGSPGTATIIARPGFADLLSSGYDVEAFQSEQSAQRASRFYVKFDCLYTVQGSNGPYVIQSLNSDSILSTTNVKWPGFIVVFTKKTVAQINGGDSETNMDAHQLSPPPSPK